jgi:murein DD-endopeptidase MepM/ murein hydrolase activator NlpD
MFFAPAGTPIVAAKNARVWSVTKGPHGIAVVLDHGAPWATFYQHLETTTLQPHAGGFPVGSKSKTFVTAGDRIGTMGFSSLDGAKLRHLHFATWFKGAGDGAAVDPEPAMKTWGVPVFWNAP